MGSDYMRRVGEAWAESNAEFEQTKPSFGARVVRAINPLTGFGSALGAMHNAAGQGDIPGMSLAAIQSVPAAAFTKVVSIPAQGLVKSASTTVPAIGKTAAGVAAGGIAGASADEYDNRLNPAASGITVTPKF